MKRINSSKNGIVITSEDTEKKLIERKRKRIQEKNKKLKHQLEKKHFELAILPSGPQPNLSIEVELDKNIKQKNKKQNFFKKLEE